MACAQTWAWGGMGGIYPPPNDLHTSGQNWLGGYGNFFHVVKKFSEKPATFIFFARRRRNFCELGGVYTPPPQRKKRAHVCMRMNRNYKTCNKKVYAFCPICIVTQQRTTVEAVFDWPTDNWYGRQSGRWVHLFEKKFLSSNCRRLTRASA